MEAETASTPTPSRGLTPAIDFDALRVWSPPLWLLGLVVAIATWSLRFVGPSAGLDASWVAGLYMASHDGLHYGTEVVFTYGPRRTISGCDRSATALGTWWLFRVSV